MEAKEVLMRILRESLRGHILPMMTQEGRPTREDVSIMLDMLKAYRGITEHGVSLEATEALLAFADPLAVATELERAAGYWSRADNFLSSDLTYWMEHLQIREMFPLAEGPGGQEERLLHSSSQQSMPLGEAPAQTQTASLQDSLERRRRIVSSDRPLIYLGGDSPLLPLLDGGVRELRPEEIVFQYGVAQHDDRLQFTMKSVIASDEVFGMEAGRDDDLTPFAYYSLKRGVVEETLDVKIFEEDGSKEYREYPLSGNEQALLLEKMEAMCLEQTGMTLQSKREAYLRTQQTPAAAPKRKGDTQHTTRQKRPAR